MRTILTRNRSPKDVEAVEERERRHAAVKLLCNAWYESVKLNTCIQNKAIKEIIEIAKVSAGNGHVTRKQAERIAGEYVLKCSEVETRHEDKGTKKTPLAIVELIKRSSTLLYSRKFVTTLDDKRSMFEYQSKTLAEYGYRVSARTIKSWYYDEQYKK